jgi:VWFA-related protein
MRLLRLMLLTPCLVGTLPDVEAQTRTPVASQAQLANQVQPPSDAAASVPTIQVFSRETLVDITATDAKGRPVQGLTKSDFSIEEDGKPQSIRSFQEFSKGSLAAAPALPKLPPNVYTNLQPTVGPLNVLLLDDVNGGDIVQARWEAAKFIKSMAPGTQVALLALGDKLTILQGPTSDPAPLLKVVNRPVKPFGVEADLCGTLIAENQATIDQLNAIATYLSGTKGRKNLIWIGKGPVNLVFPPTPGTPYSPCQDFTGQFRKTYDLLEDAQITIYPLDPGGVHGLGRGQLAMEAVAEATGGVAYYENNDLASLMVKAVDIGSSYYTLSYVPPSLAYDGRYHAISIKVNRPDVHLLYRKGYSAEDPNLIARETDPASAGKVAQPRPDSLAAAMTPIAPPATQLLFDVRVEPSTEPANPFDPPVMGALNPKLKKAPLTRYGFLFMLPQSQIAFADAGNATYSGSLEFDIAAFDPDGGLVTMRSQTLKLPLTNDEYRQFIATPFQFFQQLDLPSGQMTLRVGVLDGVSNKVGTVTIPLTIAGGSAPRPAAAKGAPAGKSDR